MPSTRLSPCIGPPVLARFVETRLRADVVGQFVVRLDEVFDRGLHGRAVGRHAHFHRRRRRLDRVSSVTPSETSASVLLADSTSMPLIVASALTARWFSVIGEADRAHRRPGPTSRWSATPSSVVSAAVIRKPFSAPLSLERIARARAVGVVDDGGGDASVGSVDLVAHFGQRVVLGAERHRDGGDAGLGVEAADRSACRCRRRARWSASRGRRRPGRHR